MDYAGIWMPHTYYDWCPQIKVWPAAFPRGPQGKNTFSFPVNDGFAVVSGSEHPAEAYEFVEWMSFEGNYLWAMAGVATDCVVAHSAGVPADWPEIFGDEAAAVAKWWAEQASYHKATRNFPEYAYMHDELSRVLDLAIHKTMTAQEALDEVQVNVQREIDKRKQT